MFSIKYPADLPITARRGEIVAALRAHPVVIVAGETGSGKTTQLPKMCLEAMGFDAADERQRQARLQRIGCTQPRRVAALSVSRRVAEELGVTWGREVGCKIRFGDDTGGDTRIKFMTDGILLAEVQSDPLLRAYSVLIIDEAHERSLNIDFLLGYLQELRRRRPHDLKVVITSATIDTAAFSEAFGGAPIIEVSGRLFPVEIRYATPETFQLAPAITAAAANLDDAGEELSHIEAAVQAAENALIESDAGDVLIFLPTEREIQECRELLERSLGAGTEVIGLFGRMPAAEQTRIFSPGPRRRVIVATNIAETSLTIPTHPLRGGRRIVAHQPLQSAHPHQAPARRGDLAKQRQPARGPRRPRAGRHLHPPVRPGGFRQAPALHSTRDPARQSGGGHPAHEGVPPRRNRNVSRFLIRRCRCGHQGAGYGLLHELGALDEAHETHPARTRTRAPAARPDLGHGCSCKRGVRARWRKCWSSPPA